MTFTDTALGIVEMLDTARPPDGTREGRKRLWTMAELRLLRESYPAGGLPAALAVLPGRSGRAIYSQAKLQGLRAPRQPRPRQLWPNSPHIDDAIRRAWPGCVNRRALLQLAQAVGRPRWWVTKRARSLGLLVPRAKPEAWAPAELALLRQHGGKGLEALAQRLRRAGFGRSETAIAVKLKREGIRRERDADGQLSVAAVREIMGVTQNTVLRWIEKGFLRARQEGTGQTAAWRVKPADLRRFVLDHTAVFDIRKVEKFFFVDLVAGRGGDDA